MIDFRYHIVSIVAVFLALALGLVIGSTSLRGKVAGDITTRTDAVVGKYNKARADLSEAQSELSSRQAFDSALLPYAVQDRLAGQSVVVISAPGADGGARSDLQRALTTAGATLAGDVRLQDGLLDPEQDQFLATLVGKVAPRRVTLAGSSGAERALGLLADVLGTRPQAHPLSPRAVERVLSAYEDAQLLSVSGDRPHPASLALLLAPPAPTPGSDDTAGQAAAARVSLLGELAADLDAAAVGAVVAGPATAGTDGGLLDAIRGDKTLRGQVSTVDSVDLPNGLIATVLALRQQAGGQSGSYGLVPGADAPLPSPTPAP